MGIVIEADYHQKKFIIEFENNGALEIAQKNMKNISLAYCLTVHKVQGSEFPCVITVMHSSHYIMLHQNLIYTSVSRAKNQSYILGDMRGIKKAAKNKQVDKRRTFLSLMGENR
ncbi:ATP-binding domain-containing protein [candidate division KSB1 bacterium]|nr:ATP-binding domain-containing protein [candidate division KSB1 bacterium]